jgi:hypothetical protein
MNKDMNPTRMVTMGIVAFAVISVLALGLNGGGSSTAAGDAATSTPAPAALAQPASAQEQITAKSSNEFNAWVDDPSVDEPAADEPDEAPQEQAPAPPPPSVSHEGGGTNADRPIGLDYE